MGNLTSNRHDRHDTSLPIDPPRNSTSTNLQRGNPNSIRTNPSNLIRTNPSNPITTNPSNSIRTNPSNPIITTQTYNNRLHNCPSYDTNTTTNSSLQLTSYDNNNIQPELPGFSFEYTMECTFITDTYCCICFKDYIDGLTMQMLPCNHVIHKDCLSDWYTRSTTCPLCRCDTTVNTN